MKKVRVGKWDDTMYVQSYVMAKSGASDNEISKTLGMSHTNFDALKLKKPALQDALRRARRVDQKVFRDYVYGKLQPETKALWDRICLCEKIDDPDRDAWEIIKDVGDYTRKQLFIYALVHTNFNPSNACKKVGIGRDTLRYWMKDETFQELMKEIHWHKCNFFEEALVMRIKDGDTAAIIFANRTMNRDRGYGDKVEVEHTGTVQHNHLLSQVNLEELDLSLETRREILLAIRKKKEQREPKLIQHREITHEEKDV